jgi:hypothetical protein
MNAISFAQKIVLAAVFSAVGATCVTAASVRVIDPKQHHLGNDVVERWKEAPAEPGGFDLKVNFNAVANDREKTLSLMQRDVDNKWTITLNGKKIGELAQGKELKVHYYRIPPNSLKKGKNQLHIYARRSQDDITVGGATIHDATFSELMNLQTVVVAVRDKSTGKYVPAKLTFTDKSRALVPVYSGQSDRVAVRTGIVYTLGVPTACELSPGEYLVNASRGTEWSMDRASLVVTDKGAEPIELSLQRELDTTGWVAADTHIHTLTFSGHGDSSVEERMITLTAEGVELAIATDHNHQTDFKPFQEKLGLNEHFTSVTGNEVTTKNGHFNSFPLPPGKDIPAYNLEDWEKLVAGIRAKGARVVILNHPRWPDIPRGPFGKFGLNRASGDRASGGRFTFDALELINSGTLQPDPLFICRDWFALLNHGEKITAVGSSDSHTVGKVVGQGRTYVPSKTDVPSRINVDAACEAFLGGRTSVSMGIIANVTANGRYSMGDQLTGTGNELHLDVRVQAPSWVSPRRVIVYANGIPLTEKSVPSVKPGAATDLTVSFQLAPQKNDAWLVCVVLGDAVTNPAWATAQKYTFAATNPIYVDADRDGKWASPRETAETLLAAAGNDWDRQWAAVQNAEDPIAIQMVSLLRLKSNASQRKVLDSRLAGMDLFKEFLRYAPKAK